MMMCGKQTGLQVELAANQRQHQPRTALEPLWWKITHSGSKHACFYHQVTVEINVFN